MKGRVAVLKAYGGEFELREYPVPDPEPGAILIKLTRAGVCGSDLHIWRGEMKEVYGALPRDLTFRPRDVRARRAPGHRRHHRLHGPAPRGGRPGGVLLLLPLRPLSGVPAR